MNNQNQSPNNTQNTPPPYSDWREQRRAERQARREARWQRHGGHAYPWIGGAILIFLGIVFLLENLNIPFVQNWWALFILIPALGAFAGAWNLYRDAGRFTQGVAGSLAGGIILTGLSLIFLFNIGGGLLWPLLLIAGGLLFLVGAIWPR